jgi:AmiR/NasT family two-component response regulator
MIAQMRAEGLLQEEHAMHLREALRSSRTIGAAIGIVMVDRNVSEDEAFAVLSRASQDANRKLSAIALEIMAHRSARHLPRRAT